VGPSPDSAEPVEPPEPARAGRVADGAVGVPPVAPGRPGRVTPGSPPRRPPRRRAPRFEANFYGKDDVERGLGTGLSDASLALRLRYEIRRELAPYIGVEWIDEYSGTEDLTRAAGGDPSDIRFVLGLRFWL
jgi:hypothetical protein